MPLALPITASLPPVSSWREEVLWLDHWVGVVAFVITEVTKNKTKYFRAVARLSAFQLFYSSGSLQSPCSTSYSWTRITIIISLYQPFIQVQRTGSCLRASILSLVGSHPTDETWNNIFPALGKSEPIKYCTCVVTLWDLLLKTK